MVPRGVRDPLVEGRGVLRRVVLIVERLEVDVRGQRPVGSDHVEQSLYEHVDTAYDRADGAQSGVHHREVAAPEAERHEIAFKRAARVHGQNSRQRGWCRAAAGFS
jgi:hypothetical protein